jgi:hypothetical protein
MKKNKLKVNGKYDFIHMRDGKEIDRWSDDNIVVNEGLNHFLDVAFSNGTATSTWFVGLFKNNFTPISTNVMATFPGVGVANESTTEYSEATRPTWVEPGPSAQSITNTASPAVFTFTAATSIFGAFLSSSSVKGGTSGILASATKLAAARSMIIGDVLNVVYTFNITSV